MTKEDEAKVLQLIKDNDEQNLKAFIEQIEDRREEIWEHIFNLGKAIGALKEYPEDYPQYYFRDAFRDIEDYCTFNTHDVKRVRLLEYIGFYWTLFWLCESLYDIEVNRFL